MENCAAIDLPGLRKAALMTLQEEINKKYHGKNISKEYFGKLLEKFENETTTKRPYLGILIQWLRKKAN
ncbi:hypothetical protein KQI69_00765 [Eubacterium sp. MSJ-13]|uniref:hypothetical protein n=1 Tax=Eubacterium sp. MSJ-13 TaxID=2841513 RepID=UPI001C106F99|nr:hypothetical protein [Eubacterium sp. MSJ-13]MBU5477731.1 hypothetical protein [Eubacterium sp. MSJ-13]